MYYKLGKACVTNWGSFVLLQIRANVVTNWGSFIITNWGKCCYKLGQLLQIRATVITKQGSYYKLGQVLQIRAIIANWGIAAVSVQPLLPNRKCNPCLNRCTKLLSMTDANETNKEKDKNSGHLSKKTKISNELLQVAQHEKSF